MAAGDPIKLGSIATKAIFGLPQYRPFVVPRWLERLQLIKLVFRPQNLGVAFMRDGNSVRQFYVQNEHYYFTIDERFECGRNQR